LTTSASTSTRAVRLNTGAALGAVLALAAALRFYAIGSQSFWLDESFTASIVSGSFGHVISAVPDTESTPHLYYVLAWLWAQVFGHGEAGLRSLSAVFGVATVGVGYAAARELWDERAGLAAALLLAVNPYLVWYSQEARSYSLLVLLSVTTVWLLATRRFWWWAVAGVAALATHYFAAFVLVPEAAYVLFAFRKWKPLIPIAVAGIALAPLALHQRASGSTKFISDIGLGHRLVELPKKFVTGELGTPTPAIGAIAAIAVAIGIAMAPKPGWRIFALAVASVAIPVVLAIVGFDYLLSRNVLPAYAIAALPAGAGLARLRPLLALVALLALFVNLQVTKNTTVQRDDWRGAAKALGPATTPRAIVVTSAPQAMVLEHYAGAGAQIPASGASVAEIDVIGNARPPRYAVPPTPPGFTLAEHRKTNSWELYRYRADAPATVAPATLLQSKLGTKDAAILVQTGDRP
jgi:4-amino-4-deoxy-L-arabinose transferase-like glycosyltransferase